MNQALHIFRKDLHHHWKMIALLWAELALLVAIAGPGNERLMWLCEAIAAAIAAILVASSVNEEPTAGENEFWMTRPYHRISLLGGKAFFTMVLVAAPMLLANFAMLSRIYPGIEFSRAVFLDSLLQLGALFLTFLTLGATTSKRTQWAFNLGLICLFYIEMVGFNLGGVPDEFGFDRPKYFVLILLGALVAWLQYSGRRPEKTLAILFLAWFGLPWVSTPWGLAWAFQRLTGPSALVHVALDSSRQQLYQGSLGSWSDSLAGFIGDIVSPPKQMNCAAVPIKISGLLDGSRLLIAAVKSTDEARDGRREETRWLSGYDNFFDRPYVQACREYDGKLSAKELVNIRVTVIAAAYEPVSTVVRPADRIARDEGQALGVGPCHLRSSDHKFECHPQRPWTRIVLKITGNDSPIEIKPQGWGAAMLTSPPAESSEVSKELVQKLYAGEVAITLTEYRLKGFVRPEFTVEKLRFSDIPEYPH